MPIVHPIHVREGEVVDIHWRRKDGSVQIERRETPPPSPPPPAPEEPGR